jgi:serine/threonine protein kinase
LSDHIGTQTIVGTAGYMPMEQIMGRSCEATDLYAVGITLIYLLSHTDPINLPVRDMKIAFNDVVSVTYEFASFLDMMIDPDVKRRFQNAKEALSFLDNAPQIVLKKDIRRIKTIHKKKIEIEDSEWEAYVDDFIKDIKKYHRDLYDEDFY